MENPTDNDQEFEQVLVGGGEDYADGPHQINDELLNNDGEFIQQESVSNTDG